jgi:hypothetical protein
MRNAARHILLRHHEENDGRHALLGQHKIHHRMGRITAHGRSVLGQGVPFKCLLVLARRDHHILPSHRTISPRPALLAALDFIDNPLTRPGIGEAGQKWLHPAF